MLYTIKLFEVRQTIGDHVRRRLRPPLSKAPIELTHKRFDISLRRGSERVDDIADNSSKASEDRQVGGHATGRRYAVEQAVKANA